VRKQHHTKTKEKGDVSLQNSKRQQPQSINSCTARFLASQSLGGDFKIKYKIINMTQHLQNQFTIFI
jgi:hypothetical protein